VLLPPQRRSEKVTKRGREEIKKEGRMKIAKGTKKMDKSPLLR